MKKQVKAVFLITTIFLLITTTFYSVPSIPQVRANGTTVYRGFFDHGDDFLYGRWSSAEFQELANLGFNLILPTFWWVNIENSDGTYKTSAINAINTTINMAKTEGIETIPAFRVAWNNLGSGYWTWGNGYPTHDYVNLNQYGGGENGRTRYCDFLGDMAQKFPQVDAFCLWLFPYHQTSCSPSSKTTFYDTTFPAMLSAVRVHYSGDVVFVPIHQGMASNGENSDPYKSGGEVETEIDGGKYSDSSLYYGLGHFIPWSVCDGGEWDYDYTEMTAAFDGAEYYSSTYNVPMMSVEYATLTWNGNPLSTSRLACFEASLQLMASNDFGWAYCRISQSHTGGNDVLYPDQAFEINHELRDLMVKYLPPSIDFQSWQNGFEEGDFSAWNGTQTSNGEASVTSTYSYQGTYSANFTVDGSTGSYARAMFILQPVTEIYIRSYVRFGGLPDSTNTRLYFFRTAEADGTLISVAGIQRYSSSTLYWQVRSSVGVGGTQDQLDSIKVDEWYCVELYTKVAVAGNVTLWVNGTKMCTTTGDFSGVNIERAYPYLYASQNAQSSAKTFFHDSIIVDNERIGCGSPQIFKSLSFLTATGCEDPLEGVKINGTYTTDVSGFYEWANLTYGMNTFVIEKPMGYYPAWILHVHGDFYWNNTHYILHYNVTETQEDFVELYFNDQPLMYVNETSAESTISSLAVSLGTMGGDEYKLYVQNNMEWITIHSSSYNEEPFLCSGASVSSKTYDSGTQICNMTITANTTITLLFDRPTPSQWGGWWG